MNKTIRVWLDDVRPMPKDYTHHARTAWDAIKIIQNNVIEAISLDHDLGYVYGEYSWFKNSDGEVIFISADDADKMDLNPGNGYDVVCEIEKLCMLHGYKLPDCNVHSANPSASLKMNLALSRLRERLA